MTVFGWSLSNFAVVNIIGTRAILQSQERGKETGEKRGNRACKELKVDKQREAKGLRERC